MQKCIEINCDFIQRKEVTITVFFNSFVYELNIWTPIANYKNLTSNTEKMKIKVLITTAIMLFCVSHFYAQVNQIPKGFASLFNGKDFTNWKIPVGDNGHWKIIDGVIDYDAESEAPNGKDLWTEKEYKDFVLYVDFRIKETPWKNPRVPLILPSGLHKLDENGKEITLVVPDSDSGILLRGQGKSQVNIWCWPIGCGEVYGYRMDQSMPPEVRKGVTPRTNADKNIGEWNSFKITLKDDKLTVELNGVIVIENAYLPGLPAKGAIGFQHHGNKVNGEWVSPPSLVQFRNVYIKEL